MSLLTEDKKQEIKELMGKVNVAAICQEAKVKRRTIYGVLYGESSDYKSLEKFVKAARKELASQEAKKQKLQSL